MRIAICYPYLPSYRLPVFRELMKLEGVMVDIFSGLTTDAPIKTIDVSISKTDVNNGGLRWFFVSNLWLFRKQILWQSRFIALSMNSKYDAYIFHGSPYHLSTWIAAMITRLRNKKTYYWMHGINSEKFRLRDWVSVFTFYKIANGFFLYGNRASNILKKQNALAKKEFHVIYNSLDYKEEKNLRTKPTVEDFKKFRTEYFKNEDLPVIISIGRLITMKKLHLLLEANKLHHDRHGALLFNLMIVGGGAERQFLEGKASELGLNDNTHFYGENYDEAPNARLLSLSDICIVPGEIGLTAIHALSYGTPVISHNNLDIQAPEVESITPGKTGELFEYNSPEDLRKTIQNWISKYPFKTTDLMNDCYQIVDTYFNPEYQASVFQSVFGQLNAN